jgi:hypothetical protein
MVDTILDQDSPMTASTAQNQKQPLMASSYNWSEAEQKGEQRAEQMKLQSQKLRQYLESNKPKSQQGKR